MALCIQRQIRNFIQIGGILHTYPRHGAESRHQFIKRKGLYQIIIGSHIQSFHFIRHRIPGSQENHGRHIILLTHLPDYLQPVHFRHHNIQYRRIVLRRIQIFQSCLPVITGIHRISLGAEFLFNHLI